MEKKWQLNKASIKFFTKIYNNAKKKNLMHY